MQWSLTQQCGPSRGFCPECDNSFTIKSASPYGCPLGAANICLGRGSACTDPLGRAPAGFIIEYYQQGLANGLTHGPWQTGNEPPNANYPQSIPDPDEAPCGVGSWPGVRGPRDTAGCGYRVQTDIGRGSGPDPHSNFGVWLYIVIQPTAKLYKFQNTNDLGPSGPYDYYGASNDFSNGDYMQVLTFTFLCGNTGFAPGTETVIKAYPFG